MYRYLGRYSFTNGRYTFYINVNIEYFSVFHLTGLTWYSAPEPYADLKTRQSPVSVRTQYLPPISPKLFTYPWAHKQIIASHQDPNVASQMI